MKKIHALTHRLHNVDAAALFIRIAVGVVFINAGWMKVTNMDMIVQAFGSMSVPVVLAYIVSYAELIGGIMILVGFLARYAGIAIAIIMVGAFSLAHVKNGFSLANNGYEYVFVLFFAALAIVALGSGKYSLAGLLRKK